MATATKNATIKHHPILDLFPRMSDETRAALKYDISQNGVASPALLWDGMLVDGRNRMECCQELGIECPTEEFRGTYEEMFNHVMGLNMIRRHLSSSQKAAICVRAGALTSEIESGSGTKAKKSVEIVAEKYGTNRKYVQEAQKILEYDKKHNSKFLDKITNGKMTIPQVLKAMEKKVAEQGGKKSKKAPSMNGIGEFFDEEAETLEAAADAPEGSQEESSEPEPLVDGLKQPVPQKLQHVFEQVAEYDSAIYTAGLVKSMAQAIADGPASTFLRMPVIESHVADLKRALRYSKPFTTCPYCHGDGCKTPNDGPCQGSGWISKTVYDAMPQEMKDACVAGTVL